MAAHRLLYFILVSAILAVCRGWDTDDLEIFDLVEEVNANFYEVFGISQVIVWKIFSLEIDSI